MGLGFELGLYGSIVHHTIKLHYREGRRPSSCSRITSYLSGQPTFTNTKQVEDISSHVHVIVVWNLSIFWRDAVFRCGQVGQGRSCKDSQLIAMMPGTGFRTRQPSNAALPSTSVTFTSQSLMSSPIMQKQVHAHRDYFKKSNRVKYIKLSTK